MEEPEMSVSWSLYNVCLNLILVWKIFSSSVIILEREIINRQKSLSFIKS